MPYNPLSVSNGFLELGFRDSVPIDPMKVQKLSFFAHGYYLASQGQPLIHGQFQAWPFGPVNPSIYEAFKDYRSNPITDYGRIYDYAQGGYVPAVAPENDPHFVSVRDFVWRQYGSLPSTQLSDMTHRSGGAWDTTWRSSGSSRSSPINDALIQAEFAPLVTPRQ